MQLRVSQSVQTLLIRNLAAFAIASGAIVAHADETNWRVLLGASVASGGDSIVNGTITTIGTTHVIPFNIKAGGDIQLRLGADYRFSDRFTLQASIAHASTDPMGIDGSLTFRTVPLEVLGFFDLTDSIRLGLGPRKSFAHMGGTGKAEGWPGLGTYTGSNGAVLELQYLWNTSNSAAGSRKSQFAINFRRVAESFSHEGVEFSGNHFEIGVAAYF